MLASITIAQAALESAWGESAPGNNLFGIKGSGTTQTTKEFINGEWVTIKAGFRSYQNWFGSITDHSKFYLRIRGTGKQVFDRCSVRDYVGAAKALQVAGYATDPQYELKLIGIIEGNGLQIFDYSKEEETLIFENDWQWKLLGDALDGLYKKGLISDYLWAEKAYTRKLTHSELSWLNTIVYARQNGIEI